MTGLGAEAPVRPEEAVDDVDLAEPAVHWLVPVAGFVAGFLAALVPAAFVTRVLRSQLPLATAVLHGHTAFVVALVLSVCVGLATAVGFAARAARG